MEAQKHKLSIGLIIFTLLYISFWPALLLFLSHDWLWREGWIFAGWFLTMSFTAILYLYRKDPALLTERYRKPGTGEQKGWDKYVVYGIMFLFFAWIILMPLDAKRYGWSAGFPLILKVLGFAAMLVSFFFFFRAFTDNTFLSPLVRVQTERKQQVVSTGVYGFVRHPMYLGAILMFFGVPLLLGSYLGIAVAICMTILLAFRTLGEEKMLLEALEGYAEYKRKVKYRFIPYVW